MSTSPEADETPEPPGPEPAPPAPERPLLTFKIRCRDGMGCQNLLFSLIYIISVFVRL